VLTALAGEAAPLGTADHRKDSDVPTKSRSIGKRPTDLAARERLRQAQVAESRATAAVYAAMEALGAAIAKREEANAAATVVVDSAAGALTLARADLVAVSGLDRAAMLLGVSKPELRKATKAEPAQQPAPADVFGAAS